MSLGVGARLGHQHVTAKLFQGGMGEESPTRTSTGYWKILTARLTEDLEPAGRAECDAELLVWLEHQRARGEL